MKQNQDTICAVATAPGGAIGVIRVSGPEAIVITNRIFTPADASIPLTERKPYTLTYGCICNDRGEVIDEVLVSLFRTPHSYTGEDSTEISCHGSTYVLQQVMLLLINNGCRTAEPGEFTQRAFLNGKMDLSQAEAVADLIASTSAGQHRLAINQMRGGFSQELRELRERLLHITSLMELELDFSDHEELEFADRKELQNLAFQIEQVISRLIHSFKIGNVVKNGIPVAIVGETNAGKSTLLNALLNEEKAIVSDIHGTTRDVIEDTVNIGGIVFRFIDTAGIRETQDQIETLGIERTFQKLIQASIVLWVIDRTEAEQQIAQLSDKLLFLCKDKTLILVLNKSDLLCTVTSDAIISEALNIKSVSISAKHKLGLDKLQSLLVEVAQIPTLSQNDIVVTNVRHYEALSHALHAICCVREGLSSGLPNDFISQDLRECIFYLSDIVGEVTTDEVLKNIFSHFCIGK